MPEKARSSVRSFTSRKATRRPSAAVRGYGRDWQKLREAFLSENPLCVKCLERGVFEEAAEVDHIVAHRGDDGLRLDWMNLQAMCKSCHASKTVAQDGGFGRPRSE